MNIKLIFLIYIIVMNISLIQCYFRDRAREQLVDFDDRYIWQEPRWEPRFRGWNPQRYKGWRNRIPNRFRQWNRRPRNSRRLANFNLLDDQGQQKGGWESIDHATASDVPGTYKVNGAMVRRRRKPKWARLPPLYYPVNNGRYGYSRLGHRNIEELDEDIFQDIYTMVDDYEDNYEDNYENDYEDDLDNLPISKHEFNQELFDNEPVDWDESIPGEYWPPDEFYDKEFNEPSNRRRSRDKGIQSISSVDETPYNHHEQFLGGQSQKENKPKLVSTNFKSNIPKNYFTISNVDPEELGLGEDQYEEVEEDEPSTHAPQ